MQQTVEEVPRRVAGLAQPIDGLLVRGRVRRVQRVADRGVPDLSLPIEPNRRSQAPGGTSDVVPTQEGVSYTVVVKASERVKKGPLEGTVKLFTTDKERSVIELPLRGEVL